jgi:hypothetical protein
MSKADDLPDFARRLQRIMGQLNFSRVALARELALDKTVVGRWLTGVNVPTEHNLTRLTEIVRRRRPDFTLADWRGDAQEFGAAANGAAPREASPQTAMPTSRARLVGLRQSLRAENGRPFLGLWGGLYLSIANRGLILACAMRVGIEAGHLYCDFTEGNFTGEGPVVVAGGRLHIVIEPGPMHDRLGFLIFGSVHAPVASLIDGIVMVPAADATGTPAASPVLMFRLDDPYAPSLTPSITDLTGVLRGINQRATREGAQTGEPWAFWEREMPGKILEALRVRVGVRREDGEIDHLLRRPASRSLTLADLGFTALPPDSPERLALSALRRLFGID